MTHPARFNDDIIQILGDLIAEFYPGWDRVFDPFAGTGQRLAELCKEKHLAFAGCDIEEWPDAHANVWIGDATDITYYPFPPFLIITSPTYGNGVNDHFEPKEDSKRYTYRTALGKPLNANNSGRYSIRGGKKSWQRYMDINKAAVEIWAHLKVPAMVNVKSFIHNHEIIDLPLLWIELLQDAGYDILDQRQVKVPCLRHGKHADVRIDHEDVIVAVI
jgi:hypothetical protein